MTELRESWPSRLRFWTRVWSANCGWIWTGCLESRAMMPTRMFEIQFREKPDTRLFRLNGRPLGKRWQNWGYYRTEREMELVLAGLAAKFPNYEFRAGIEQGE